MGVEVVRSRGCWQVLDRWDGKEPENRADRGWGGLAGGRATKTGYFWQGRGTRSLEPLRRSRTPTCQQIHSSHSVIDHVLRRFFEHWCCFILFGRLLKHTISTTGTRDAFILCNSPYLGILQILLEFIHRRMFRSFIPSEAGSSPLKLLVGPTRDQKRPQVLYHIDSEENIDSEPEPNKYQYIH
jgi:hypothetical protein